MSSFTFSLSRFCLIINMSRCSSAVEQSFVLYRVHLVLTFPKLQHLAVHLCVFFKDNVWESAQAAAVSWCDGYDEGQGAPASTSKLWSHGYTFPYTCTHAISQTRLLQEIHGRGTHTSLLICLTTTAHTHKYLISHMSAHRPVTHSVDSASKQKRVWRRAAQ